MKGEERRERSIAVKNKTESVVGRSVCVGAEELTTLKDEVRMKSSGERETDNHAGWTGVPQLRSLLGLLGMATGSAAVSKQRSGCASLACPGSITSQAKHVWESGPSGREGATNSTVCVAVACSRYRTGTPPWRVCLRQSQ